MLLIQLVGEVDIRLAIQEVSKIQPRSLQMPGIDLKIAPIERTVRVVMIDLAAAMWIFAR